MVIRCPKCGAGEDAIIVEQLRHFQGGLTGDVGFDGKVQWEMHDWMPAGPLWVICEEYMGGCGYRTKSLSVKTWMQEVDA